MRCLEILLVALACTGASCSTTAPGQLDSDARDRIAELAPRLERVPPDLLALDETVAIYAANQRYADAEDALQGVLSRSPFDPRALARIASSYATLARQAEHQHATAPQEVPEARVVELERRAQSLAALAAFRGERGHAAVTADLTLGSGAPRRLNDVMLECTSRDFEPENGSDGLLTVSYFGDRLRLDAPERLGTAPREALLGEIERLTVESDPLGRRQVRIEPSSWSRETAPCTACRITDACALVGDRNPGGGLDHVDLDSVAGAAFRVEVP